MEDTKYIDIIDNFENHLESFVDEDDILVFDDESEENKVDVYWIKPNKEYRPYSILVTCGMGRFPMMWPDREEDDEEQFIEVAMLFPMDWDFNSESDTVIWPIEYLRSIGKMAVSLDTWIEFGDTIECDKSKGGYFPGTRFNSAIIFPSIKLPKTFTNIENGDDLINIYSAIPLYPEELNFKQDKGSNILIDKFNKFDIQEIIDIKRINTCK